MTRRVATMVRPAFLAPRLTPLERRLLAYIGDAKRSRGEVSLCRRFGGIDQSASVLDALFRLFTIGLLDWFAADDDGAELGDLPLRYRVTTRGRKRLKRKVAR